MIETIYLVVDHNGVQRMTKRIPALYKGEIPVKLTVEVDPGAFKTPVLEKYIVIENWRQGTDIADVEFKENIITEEEAEIIRTRRLDKMQEILEEQGYVVSKAEESDE